MSTRLPARAARVDRPHAARSASRSRDGHRRDFAGDCVTSALWAAGERLLGRSFKYHRPRGVLSLANHDVNAMFQWGARLNLRGDVEPLAGRHGAHRGQHLRRPRTRPGALARQAGRASCRSASITRPSTSRRRCFPRWERLIRATTGLGAVDFETPRRPLPKRYLHARRARGRGRRGGALRRDHRSRVRRAGGAGGRERARRRQPRLPARGRVADTAVAATICSRGRRVCRTSTSAPAPARPATTRMTGCRW